MKPNCCFALLSLLTNALEGDEKVAHKAYSVGNKRKQVLHFDLMSGRVTEEDLVNEAQDVVNDTVEVAQALMQKDQNKADGEGAGAQAAVKGALEAASNKAAASYTAARDRVRQAGSTAAGATQAAVEVSHPSSS